MSWKFRLLFVFLVVLAAVAIVKLPSQADTNGKISPKDEGIPSSDGRAVEYPNGIYKLSPINFAVSEPVRDMPTVADNSLLNRAGFVSPEELREMRAKKLGGIESDKDDDAEEINKQNAEEIKKIIPGAGAGYGDFIDPLVGKSAALKDAPQAMPTPTLTFDGATQADNAAQGIGALLPPDVNGDIGPNHFVSSVNLVFKVFNKSGTVVAGPTKTSNLFAALPANDPCRTRNDGDPVAMYDPLADRWHISQFSLPSSVGGSGANNYQCVALSTTGDPTGSYYVWSYVYPGGTFNDYPKVGVWTDAYHMTFNQFNNAGTAFLGLGVLSQDRAKALVGDPTAGAVYINIGATDASSGGALPGDIDGFVGPPAGLAEVIGYPVSDETGSPFDGLRIYKWVPNFTTPANSVLTLIGNTQLAPFDFRNPSGRTDIEQMGGANLDSLADRSMHRFAYRNFGTTQNPVNSYVGNFAVNVSGVAPTTAATYQAGVRWFEMRRTNDTFSVFDQGTHNLTPGDGANGLNNWMASIAQDYQGDIALGFSQAGTNQKANIMIAGRTNNVANSGVLNEGETLFYAAGGSQTSTSSRWGDYSAMNADPSDDCTMWYTQEYYATTSNAGWSTRVGKFKFPGCTAAPIGTITGTITFCAGGAPISGASVDATGGFNRVTGADGTYSMRVSPGTYTVTANKAGGFTAASQNVTVTNGGTATVNICLSGVAVVTSGNVAIVSESCGTPNGAPDPGETLTVSLPLQNTGATATTNLTATLQSTGGVTNPTPASQNYGALTPGGAAVTRNFTFTVDPALTCGANVTLTFLLTDGATSYGTVTKTFQSGSQTVSLSQNFDGVTAPALPSGWTSVQTSGTGINWVTTTTTPNSAPNAAFASDPAAVNAAALVSPSVTIGSASAQLKFKNQYTTESTFDGEVLEYSTNGGTTWTDVITGGGTFVSGGYNATISTSFMSPIGGRMAWSGSSSGYVDTVVNLPASLNGQNVQFRWLMASDSSVSATGVWVDDVQVLGGRTCNGPCGTNQCRFQRRFDYDGDNKADVSVYRPGATGVWYLLNSGSASVSTAFGTTGDKIVPADYDGDGKTDIAVYRGGTWYIQRSTLGFTGVTFGAATDIPQPADLDNDGKAELVVFRPSTGTWFTYNLATGATTGENFGASGDKPVIGDYDGDCKGDFAVFRPSTGAWYVHNSSGGFSGVVFGQSGDVTVPADYDGDGKTDVAVFRNGTWYIQQSTAGFTGVSFGFGTDLPVPADYDGDGKADVGVFRSSTGTWYIQRSTAGFTGVTFGASIDTPTPYAYIP